MASTELPRGPYAQAEAAAVLGVVPSTVHRWVKFGMLRPSPADSAIDPLTGDYKVMRFTGATLRRFVLLRVLGGDWGNHRPHNARIPLALWGDAAGLAADLANAAGSVPFRLDLRDLCRKFGDRPPDPDVAVERLRDAFVPEAEDAIAEAFGVAI